MTIDNLNESDVRMSYGKSTLTQLTPLRKKQLKMSQTSPLSLPANEQRESNQ